jgi:hypothetical protein
VNRLEQPSEGVGAGLRQGQRPGGGGGVAVSLDSKRGRYSS